jgi:dipeptidase
MCDSFVALPQATAKHTVILGKSADCQINEALAFLRIPGRKHLPGEAIKTAHIVIPQAAETYEMIMGKSFWTWGGEIGINEYGVAIGNEAVFTTLPKEEKRDGLVVTDMLRIGLERGKTALEAVEAIATLLEQFGQGGNCELSGNSHFDGSYLISDSSEAWVLETAGREWVAKKITTPIGSISNILSIQNDWDISSIKERLDWAKTYGEPEILPRIGSSERQANSFKGLEAHSGSITVQTAFDVLRHHGEDYDPATAPVHTNICVHAGPFEDRQWQATGAMVSEVGPDGIIGWFTATSSTCLSIFKPVFPGVEVPNIGPYPNEQFNPESLWWKHELMHRRAMADFHILMPEIRKDFNAVEAEFLTEANLVLKGSYREKKEFVEYCFRKAELATEQWTRRLVRRSDLSFRNPDYRVMWQKYNQQAGMAGLPA